MSTDEGLTHDRVVGTPEYMAPEQALGKPVTGKADLYSLGVIAYRALTGRPAFTGGHIGEILHRVTHDMPPCPTDFTTLHPDVASVLAIMLAKSPADRFDSADELATAIETAARGELDPALRERGARVLAKNPWGPAAE
jgi:serine/threonine-protein kinase